MSKFVWKEKKIVSIETRSGLFVLAQLGPSPYLIFFDLFSHDNDWSGVRLEDARVLFWKPVTRQFLKQSRIEVQDLAGVKFLVPPTEWISPRTFSSRKITLWKGLEQEVTIFTIGDGGKLIEHDPALGGVQEEKVLRTLCSPGDDEVIDRTEDTSLGAWPELNERLYLCHELKRPVNPTLDLLLDRELPLAYVPYVGIVSGGLTKEEWQRLPSKSNRRDPKS